MVEGDARVQSALDLLLARVDWATLKGENVDFWRLKNINIYIYIYIFIEPFILIPPDVLQQCLFR